MLDKSKVYPSNSCGYFKVVDYVNSSSILIKFIETGYETTVQITQLKKGNVKDRLKPSILGVGFIGDGKHKSRINGKNSKAYQVWKSMIFRCYCKKAQVKSPSYIGCSVTKEWHNFQVFAKWFYQNHIEGYQIDKDIKVEGNRVYSPDTCLFVSVADNVAKANAKYHNLTSPKGEFICIYNLLLFCRENKLSYRSMKKVKNGLQVSHKGWSIDKSKGINNDR